MDRFCIQARVAPVFQDDVRKVIRRAMTLVASSDVEKVYPTPMIFDFMKRVSSDSKYVLATTKRLVEQDGPPHLWAYVKCKPFIVPGTRILALEVRCVGMQIMFRQAWADPKYVTDDNELRYYIESGDERKCMEQELESIPENQIATVFARRKFDQHPLHVSRDNPFGYTPYLILARMKRSGVRIRSVGRRVPEACFCVTAGDFRHRRL